MSDPMTELLKAHLKQLRLPTMGRSCEKLAREAAAERELTSSTCCDLTELSWRPAPPTRWRRASSTRRSRCRRTSTPTTSPRAAADQAEGAGAGARRVDRAEVQLLPDRQSRHGQDARGHGLGPGGLPAGQRVRFFTAAALVSQLEEAQKQYTPRPVPGPTGPDGPADLRRAGLPVVQPRRGRSCCSRCSPTATSGESADHEQPGVRRWGQVFQGERMTAALLDRLTHRCHIFEMNGESYRFRESMKAKKSRKAE